jgi:nicotinamidase-related amidase
MFTSPIPSAVLFIDMQLAAFTGEVVPPIAGHHQLLRNAIKLREAARRKGVPAIFIQHCGPDDHPLNPAAAGWPLHPDLKVEKGDQVVEKTRPDAFAGTRLQEVLEELGVKRVILCGLQTEVCIDTTCRRANSLGYEVVLARDTHSTWDTPDLTAAQIIAHHNRVLGDWFAETLDHSEILAGAGVSSSVPS